MRFGRQIQFAISSRVLPSCILFGVALSLVFSNATFGQNRTPEETASAGKSNLWTRDGLDWPSFLGPMRNGCSKETGLRFDWSDEQPSLVWSHRIGEGYGAGSVSNGRYFHFDRNRDEARLIVRNAETGKELWQFTYPTDYVDAYGFDGGPRCSPVIDEGRVYLFGVEGMLHCLDEQTGTVIWKLDTGKKFGVIQNFFGVGSTPLIHGDLLLTMIGGSPDESQELTTARLDQVKSNGSALVALDKLTGEVRYKALDDLASYASLAVAEMNGKPTGLLLGRTKLFGFDPQTGKQLFEHPYRARKFESVNASTPVVADGRVLLTESYELGGRLLQVDSEKPDSMNVVWKDERLRNAALDCHWNTPVVVDGHIYASTGQHRGTAQLRCIELSTGEVKWSEPKLGRSSLTYVDGHMICVTEEGRLFAFTPNETEFAIVGEVKQEDFKMIFPCWSAAVVAHGYLFVRGKSKVFCFDIKK